MAALLVFSQVINYGLKNLRAYCCSSTSDTHLKFRELIIDKVNKAYSVFGIIKRNFVYLSETSFCTIYIYIYILYIGQ